jgi:hypothetical protein
MTKGALQCLALALVVVFGVSAQPSTTDTERFNPSGEYHPLNRPAEDIGDLQFHLQVRYRRRTLVAWGDVYGHESQFYKFRLVSVTQKHLRFSTQRLRGVTYTFEGTFLRSGNFATQDPPPGSFPLEGTLRKFVGGRKVMDLTTSFVYYVGC